jgi:hypothetical protein
MTTAYTSGIKTPVANKSASLIYYLRSSVAERYGSFIQAVLV